MEQTDDLTLDTLLADPLTQLVMRSDNITVEDTARAFHDARRALGATAGRTQPTSWRLLRAVPYCCR